MSKHPEGKIEVETSATGGKIAVTGDGTDRLINAAADIISPASQGLGAVGDAIQQFRVHRKVAAALALERMKQIKEEQGEPVTPISPKILAPWLEGVSSEDPQDEVIRELWARMLANATDETVSETLVSIGICKSLTKREAECFVDMMSRLQNETSSTLSSDKADRQTYLYEYKLHMSYCQGIVSGTLDSIGEALDKNVDDENSYEETMDIVIDIIEKERFKVPIFVYFEVESSAKYSGYYQTNLVDEVIELLVSIGLMQKTNSIRKIGNFSISFSYIYFTAMAFSLYNSIQPDS